MIEKVKNFYKKYKLFILIALMVILIALPYLIKRTIYVRYICNILMWATLAGSLNAINGYSGQMCLGQAGFFAIGAYSGAILAKNFGIDFWLCLLIGGIISMIMGLLVSLPTSKLSGIYLSIVTLGASEIIRIIAQTWEPVTGGSLGIKQIPYPSFFGIQLNTPREYYYIFLAILIVFNIITSRVLKSRVGRAWVSIREDQIAAKSLGVETSRYKRLNFMYGAFWAGVIGVAYAPFVTYIESSQFSLDTGWNVLAMVILGGQGTLAGPIVGSAIVTLLTESLRFLENWRYVIYAALIIFMMWVRPQGLVGASNSMLAGREIKMKDDKRKNKKTKKMEVKGNE